MVHYPLLIITRDQLDETALESFLEPWMGEQMPEGIPELREVDVADDLRRIFDGSRRWRVYGPDGACLRADHHRFYREATAAERGGFGTRPARDDDETVFWHDWADGRGVRPKIWSLPAGWMRRMVPLAEIMTFQDFVTDLTRESMRRVPRHEVKDYGRLHFDDVRGSLQI